MTWSASFIDDAQARWAIDRPRDSRWHAYAATLEGNLFLGCLHPATEKEFLQGDGSELSNTQTRPAKMRALVSSSALAVNFFDAWRDIDKRALSEALGFSSPITRLRFEYKPDAYPVKPRSPNLDLLLSLADGSCVAVESKFSEPYRSADGFSAMSVRYFPAYRSLWDHAHLRAAQRVAERMRPEWLHLDVPQLLKHLLALACDPMRPGTLLYLWFDTGKPDADAHRREIERFAEEIASDSIAFRFCSYQEVFRSIDCIAASVADWRSYMAERYFGRPSTF